MNTKRSISGLLIVLITVIIITFLLKFLVKEVYTEYSSPKGEAKTNNYLAAEHFLKYYKINIKSINILTKSFDYPDSSEAAIIISSHKIYQNTALMVELFNWVEGGGKLILSGYSNIQSDKSIQLFPGKDISLKRSESTVDTELQITLFDEHYYLDLYHFSILESTYPVSWLIEDEHGIHAAAYEIGKGSLVLFNDLYLFNNANIGNKDHAKLLLAIMHDLSISELIHILRAENKSLLNLLSDYPLQLVIFLSVIFLFLWQRWGYFGPVRDYLINDKRAFLDHLKSSGLYLWKQGDKNVLSKELHDDFVSVIINVFPEWNDKTEDERISCLSSHTGISENIVKQTVNYKGDSNKSSFLTLSRNITLIRNKL